MRHYHEWLRSLSAYGRAEIEELEPAARVAWIRRRLAEEQAHCALRPPSLKDMDKLRHWMAEYVGSHESQFLESLSEAERKNLAGLGGPMRTRAAFWAVWQRWQAADPGKPPPGLTDKDLASLRRGWVPRRGSGWRRPGPIGSGNW